jgi:hypothetical protein
MAEEPKQEEAKDAVVAAWQKYASPGEHHRHLGALVGTWEVRHGFRTSPEEPFQRAVAHATNVWTLGGRFVRLSLEGEGSEEPFSGRGYIGYDHLQESTPSSGWSPPPR